MRNNRVLVALSGGVDSSVCVHLLKAQGCEVRAVVMRMSELHSDTVEAAKASASALSIPLSVLDLREEFERNVVSVFLREYARGRTPNPCVVCNPAVKFHNLLAEADRQDCGRVATGHYARILRGGDGFFRLRRGVSLKRDQSYMLYRLTQSALSRLLLPLGEREKPQVREIAAELSLSAADKPDSQENCFIPDKNYAAYIEQRLGKQVQGELIAPDGTVCGQHNGIIHYTVGQRKGLGVALGRPVFVKRIDSFENRVYLADAGDDQVTEALVSDLTVATGLPFSEELGRLGLSKALVKIRSAASLTEARLSMEQDGRLRVRFDEPQRAVACGQSLVVYQNELVIGGGLIDETA